MAEFFDQVGGILAFLVQFIGNIINSLITAFSFLLYAVALPFDLIGYMPSVIGAAVLIFLSIAIIKFIIGR